MWFRQLILPAGFAVRGRSVVGSSAGYLFINMDMEAYLTKILDK